MLVASAGCGFNPRLRLAEIPGAAPVELASVPFHPQEAHHCGPASLLTLLEASGVATDYEAVVGRVYVPGLAGSLQAEMSATARQFGRVAYSLPPEPAVLLAEVTAGRPVLVLQNLGLPSRPHWHYAVVIGYDPEANRILMRSGRERRLARKAPGWLRQWDWAGRWALLLLRPEEWPAAPDRDRLLRALADFEETADPALAERAWRTAATHWPDEPTTWLGLGNAVHAREDWTAAETAYRRALALDHAFVPARLNLASSLRAAGAPCAGLDELGAALPSEHPLAAAHAELERTLRAACPAH